MSLFDAEELVFGSGGRSHIISFKLEEGECVWVNGPSGAGKTTLLRTLARLVTAIGGRSLLAGIPWFDIAPAVWRSRVVYLHQKAVMFPGTVLSNLERPFAFKSRMTNRVDLGQASSQLSNLLLSDNILERDALTLSVGESARVALVRSMLLEPEILMLDEPTAALDSKARRAMATVLAEWLDNAKRGILGVTHDEILTEMLPGRILSLEINKADSDALPTKEKS